MFARHTSRAFLRHSRRQFSTARKATTTTPRWFQVAASATAVSAIGLGVHVLQEQQQRPQTECEGGISSLFNHNFIADAAEVALPSVVNITALVNGPWGKVAGRVGGSGFILSSDGFVVTNNHVVAKASNIEVTLDDGSRYTATLHSRDEKTDIALLKINDPNGAHFPKIKIGNSASLRPGEWVVALGSPMMLDKSVTAGIVSSTARDLNDLGFKGRTDFIQTDAAINQGNSGGPLVNLQGEVIGINTLKLDGDGIGFAIPIDAAMQIIDHLRKHGHVVRPYLGLRMLSINPVVMRRQGRRLGIPEEVTHGVLVVDIAPNSPGENSGLQPGDVIVEFDQVPVYKTFDIIKALGYEVGLTHTVKVFRSSGKQETIQLTSQPST